MYWVFCAFLSDLLWLYRIQYYLTQYDHCFLYRAIVWNRCSVFTEISNVFSVHLFIWMTQVRVFFSYMYFNYFIQCDKRPVWRNWFIELKCFNWHFNNRKTTERRVRSMLYSNFKYKESRWVSKPHRLVTEGVY